MVLRGVQHMPEARQASAVFYVVGCAFGTCGYRAARSPRCLLPSELWALQGWNWADIGFEPDSQAASRHVIRT